MILLKNCRLIPELTEGYEGLVADVLIDAKKIRQIAEPGTIEAEADVQVIDIEGNTLLPGFFDLHAHLYLSSFDFQSLNERSAADTGFDVYGYARDYLKAGYTTIRDCGCSHNATVALERARKKGIVNVPRVISTGLILTPTENGNSTFKALYKVVDTPEEVRKAAREQFELGNDAIKYMVTGAYFNESGDPGAVIAMEDEVREAVKVAAMKKSYVIAHTHSAEGIKLAIRAGVYTVEHCIFIDDEAIAMLKDNDNCFMVATGAIGLDSLDEDNELISADSLDKSKKYEAMERQSVNKAYQAGLKIGFGSDIDWGAFVKHPGYEFIARTEWYDFDYKDILLQATKYSAEIAKLDDQLGTIKEGKNAELVVVEGNPDEDIYVMKKLPKYVFYNGEIIEN